MSIIKIYFFNTFINTTFTNNYNTIIINKFVAYVIFIKNRGDYLVDITKKVIIDSFKELASKKNVSDITVKEITDKCGLKRQTF